MSARNGRRRAFHLCLKGRFFWSKRYEGGLKTARECFEEALRIDPNLALAHAGLADTYSFLGFYCLVRPRDAFAIAKTSVERALALDEGLAEAHTSLGLLKLGGDWDWPAAVRAFRARSSWIPRTRPRASICRGRWCCSDASRRRTRKPSAPRTSIRCRRS